MNLTNYQSRELLKLWKINYRYTNLSIIACLSVSQEQVAWGMPFSVSDLPWRRCWSIAHINTSLCFKHPPEPEGNPKLSIWFLVDFPCHQPSNITPCHQPSNITPNLWLIKFALINLPRACRAWDSLDHQSSQRMTQLSHEESTRAECLFSGMLPWVWIRYIYLDWLDSRPS